MIEVISICISLFISIVAIGVTVYTFDRGEKNKQKIEEIKSELDIKSNVAIELSTKQSWVLETFPRILSNYYDENILSIAPKNMQNKTKYKDIEDILSKRLIHAAFEIDKDYGEKILNSANPIVALNTLMLDTATSAQTVLILTYSMNKIYTGEKLGIENFEMYMYPLIYKNLVSDYKKIEIENNTLLKFIIKDFDEIEANENFEKIMQDIGL